jgi:hypothetical protein
VSDTPEETARKKQLLREIWSFEKDMELHNEQLTIDEIVRITKQVRKEMAEERAKGEQSEQVD